MVVKLVDQKNYEPGYLQAWWPSLKNDEPDTCKLANKETRICKRTPRGPGGEGQISQIDSRYDAVDLDHRCNKIIHTLA